MRIDETGYPMMAEHEVEYIKAFITNNGVRTVLEWGSGNSTLYFPKECPKLEKWVSIEHNGHYRNYLKDKLSPIVDYRCFEEDIEAYIHGADGETFDLILVDGMMRKECWQQAYSLLNPHGRILLHDSGRKEYQEWFTKKPHTILYQGEKPTPDGGYAHRGLAIFHL